MKKYSTIIFAIIIFIGLSFYSFSEICCMFGASRYYGFPYSYITLGKTVESYQEANKVNTESALALIKDGWKLSFSTHMTKGLLGSSFFSLLADLTVSFLIAIGLTETISKIKKTAKK